MINHDLHTLECIPYIDGNGNISSCVNAQCTNPVAQDHSIYKIKSYYAVSDSQSKTQYYLI
jgi:hypothetical protein